MRNLIWSFVCLSVVYASNGHAAEASMPLNPAVANNGGAIHLSVFIDDPSSGKDPFFPNSTRRQGRRVQPTPTITPTQKDPVIEIFEGLELKGISLGANKKLAIINNYTFAEGEKWNVKVGNQTVEVLCISIQERSVSVIVNGRIRKELNLRDGL